MHTGPHVVASGGYAAVSPLAIFKSVQHPVGASRSGRHVSSASTSSSHMPRLVARSAIVLSLAAALVSSAPLAAQQRVVGLDVAGMDTTVRPGNDFYRYANGGWDRTTSIPADRSSLTSFAVTAQRARAQLTSLTESYAGAGRVGGERQRIGDFYTAYVDTVTLARRGITPIRPLLDSIARIDDRTALARFFGAHLRADVDVLNLGAMHTENLFGLWVDADFNRPTRTAAVLLQGGAALPDRSYYLDSSSSMVKIRDAYRAHVGRMLTLGGVPNATAAADSVLALETRISRVHWSQEDSWEPTKGNNHWARADFGARAPGLDWNEFFRAARLTDMDTIVAWQPSAVTGLSALVASTPLATWRALLAYHALMHRASELSPDADREWSRSSVAR